MNGILLTKEQILELIKSVLKSEEGKELLKEALKEVQNDERH